MNAESLRLGTGPEESVEDLIVFPDGEMIAAGIRLLSSDDRGQSWTQLAPLQFTMLAIHPSGDLYGAYGPDGRVRRSTDRGISWSGRAETDSLGWISDIEATTAGNVVASTLHSGVFRSEDHGVTWSYVGFSGERIDFLSVDPDGSIFLPVWEVGEDSTDVVCMKLSMNSGKEWEDVSCPRDISRAPTAFTALENGKWFLGAGSKIYTSSDSGMSWLEVADLSSSPTGDFLSFGEHTYVGLSAGVGMSENEADWRRHDEGIEAVGISFVKTAPGGAVYVGTRSGARLYRSMRRDAGWERVDIPTPATGRITDIAAHQNGDVFLADGGVYRTSDSGMTWHDIRVHEGFGEYSCYGDDLQLTSDDQLYIAGSGAVFRYDLVDESCERVREKGSTVFHDVGVTNRGDLLLASNVGVEISTDHGLSWEAASIAENDVEITELLVVRDSVVLAATRGSGVFRSSDYGRSFEFIFQREPYICCIDDFARSETGAIYAASRTGVIRSSDEGRTWESVNEGVPTENIVAASFDNEGYLYVGTADAGVYRSATPVGVSRQTDEVYVDIPSFSQNYPNPFREATTFEFTLRQAEHVQIVVYDITGREVAVLTDRYYGPGEHKVIWRPDRTPSGVYLGQMRTGEHTVVHRFVRMR